MLLYLKDNAYNKDPNDSNYPKYKKINTRKSTNYKKNGPRILTLLAAGTDLNHLRILN